jgi:hypothetical protein
MRVRKVAFQAPGIELLGSPHARHFLPADLCAEPIRHRRGELHPASNPGSEERYCESARDDTYGDLRASAASEQEAASDRKPEEDWDRGERKS